MSESLTEQLRKASDSLFADNLYFVPVRHHSPACAFALQALIREIRPAAVLIEGPDDMEALLPLMRDAQTRSPVAVLCQSSRMVEANIEADDALDEEGVSADSGSGNKPEKVRETRSAFFPFCHYSPEWVAIQTATETGAQTAFIDLPWSDKAWFDDEAPEQAQSLMTERYFSHSRYLNALAAKTGCRDHDDLWDHLFELRSLPEMSDWRTLFTDVFAYCAATRFDYEPQVLEADGSLPRERHMAQHIRQWREQIDGPIVVVTGGFHTSSLLELLQTKSKVKKKPGKTAQAVPELWLIRYSFDRLDALNGYNSGMPSPAYYQWIWESLQRGEQNPQHVVSIDCLSTLARQTREKGLAEQLSTADVQAAVLQAMRLAALRGHAGPGRQDLLDAVRSCFIKGSVDDGTGGLTSDLRRFLAGSQMGDVPPSAGSPPLLENVRQLARRFGVRLDDSSPRQTKLDLYRKPSHRERSRFFHMTNYLSVGLVNWTSGPDFLANTRLELLFEEWRVAWTPIVEARLIELAYEGNAEGNTLSDVALAKLRREEKALSEQGQGRSAQQAVILLIRACLIGLHERLPSLFAMLSAHLDEDASFASVVGCGHRLMTLWRAREPLGVRQHPELLRLMHRIWPAALYLLPDLINTQEADEGNAISHLLSLREFGRMLKSDHSSDTRIADPIDLADMHEHLQRFIDGQDTAAGICGAASALLFLDGCWNEKQLIDLLNSRFGVGALPHDATRFLMGLMRAAPELLLREPQLLAAFDQVISSWDDTTFTGHLPDLRYTFAQLNPRETSRVAEQVASWHGNVESDAQSIMTMNYEVSEQDLLAGTRLQLDLVNCLRRDALECWLNSP